MKKILLPAIAVLLLAACATTDHDGSTAAAGKSHDEKQYRVGSRIPVRDPVSSSPSSTVDPSAMTRGTPARVN